MARRRQIVNINANNIDSYLGVQAGLDAGMLCLRAHGTFLYVSRHIY